MTKSTVAAPYNLRRVAPEGREWRAEKDGYEYLYRYSMNKNGRYHVECIYTGRPTGTIGSGGKSFATAAERDAATLASCLGTLASRSRREIEAGWEKVGF